MASDTHGGPKTASPPARVARRRVTGSSVTLTGRGGLVVVFGLTLLGSVGDSLLDLHTTQGLLFVVGCLLAVVLTRRADLLPLVVSPPLIFFLVTLLSAVAGSFGDKSFVTSVVLSVATTLTSSVSWLFLGAVLVVGIAVPRGLPASLRELRERVAADNPFRGRGTLLGRKNEDDDPVRWDETPGPDPGVSESG